MAGRPRNRPKPETADEEMAETPQVDATAEAKADETQAAQAPEETKVEELRPAGADEASIPPQQRIAQAEQAAVKEQAAAVPDADGFKPVIFMTKRASEFQLLLPFKGKDGSFYNDYGELNIDMEVWDVDRHRMRTMRKPKPVKFKNYRYLAETQAELEAMRETPQFKNGLIYETTPDLETRQKQLEYDLAVVQAQIAGLDLPKPPPKPTVVAGPRALTVKIGGVVGMGSPVPVLGKSPVGDMAGDVTILDQ